MKAQPQGGHAEGKGPKPEPKTFAEALKALSPQRRKFVITYIETPNARLAAIKAGYSEQSARNQGPRLMTNDDVKTAIRLAWAEGLIDAKELRARTEEIIRSTLEDFFSFDTEQVTPHRMRPVTELLAELQLEIQLEDQYAARAHLSEEEQESHEGMQRHRQRTALRYQLLLEHNPRAELWAAGPPEFRQVPRLDLAKARDLGVLHLLKSLKYTRHGPAIELESREHAREMLAKHLNFYGEHGEDDQRSGFEAMVEHLAALRAAREDNV